MPDEDKLNQFGDYVVILKLRESVSTITWLAEQKSVGRKVLVEELKNEAVGERDTFLADVRAKASVDHPLVGSIYEASNEAGHCFFAHELLPGDSIQRMTAAGRKMRAQRFVHLLHRIADANIYHESHGNATSPLDAESIMIDAQGVVRLKNLAIAGERLPDHSTRDVMKTGAFFEPLIDLDYPGGTRCLTLLAWMRGEQVTTPLTWDNVRTYCEQIEQQLTEPATVSGPQTAAVRPEKKNNFVWVIAILLVAIFATIILLFPKKDRNTVSNGKKPGWVSIEAGDHVTPEGSRLKIEPFEISAHEVTIGEYASFVETLFLLSKDGSVKTFDHPEQPAEKTSHLPDDWTNLLNSANKGSVWKGKKVTVHTPIVGIDWWDAYAYAKWKRGFLPNQEQWLCALHSGTEEPATIPVSDLVPVTEKNPDITKNGILAMAGSVSEWTAEPRTSPDNPLGQAKWVIIGGSYRNPGKGAATREWVDDRSIRRPDIGFRICRKVE